jgi:hypothetical protein
MVLWLILSVPLVFLVAGWAWRYQHRLLCVTATGLDVIAGRPGAVVDVQLTSVLVDESKVLVGFRLAGTVTGLQGRPGPVTGLQGRPHGRPGPHGPGLAPGRHRQSLLFALGPDARVDLARLHRWQAGGVSVVMWRDRDGGRVELSHVRSGQQVKLSVVQPVVTTPAVR